MEISNVSIQPLNGGPPVHMDDAELIFGDPTIPAPKGVLSGASLITRSGATRSATLNPDVAADLLQVLNPGPKRTPILEAKVHWDPWRNPAAFWHLMTSLLMKSPGVRWRIRQATRADRLKGGAIA